MRPKTPVKPASSVGGAGQESVSVGFRVVSADNFVAIVTVFSITLIDFEAGLIAGLIDTEPIVFI